MLTRTVRQDTKKRLVHVASYLNLLRWTLPEIGDPCRRETSRPDLREFSTKLVRLVAEEKRKVTEKEKGRKTDARYDVLMTAEGELRKAQTDEVTALARRKETKKKIADSIEFHSHGS